MISSSCSTLVRYHAIFFASSLQEQRRLLFRRNRDLEVLGFIAQGQGVNVRKNFHFRGDKRHTHILTCFYDS